VRADAAGGVSAADAAAAPRCPPGTAGRGSPRRSHRGQLRLVELVEQPPDRRVRHHRPNRPG
jgi:hypothetical protein